MVFIDGASQAEVADDAADALKWLRALCEEGRFVPTECVSQSGKHTAAKSTATVIKAPSKAEPCILLSWKVGEVHSVSEHSK